VTNLVNVDGRTEIGAITGELYVVGTKTVGGTRRVTGTFDVGTNSKQ
jgi:hypothetical protein